MMQIKLGTTTNDSRTVNKSITWDETAINCTLKDDVSIFNPSFILNYNSNFLSKNYVSAFGKYYFIENIVLLDGGRCMIVCKEDVLYTYHAELNNMNFTIVRNEGKRNLEIDDSEYTLAQGFKEFIYPYSGFGGYGESNTTVLEVLGGVS